MMDAVLYLSTDLGQSNICSSHEGSVPFMAVRVWELFGIWGCLVVVFVALLCLCVQWKVFPWGYWLSEERTLHTTSLLLSSKLRYALPWDCMSRDRPALGQIILHAYILTKILYFPESLNIKLLYISLYAHREFSNVLLQNLMHVEHSEIFILTLIKK